MSTPRRRLRRSISSSTSHAKRTRAAAPPSGSSVSASCGATRAPRVADDGAGDAERLLAAPRRLLLAGEEGEVEVVGDLGGQLLEVLDQDGAGVGVAGHAEAAQHQLAELVDGRDGRRVERRQRVGQPAQPGRALGLVGVEQPVVQPVGGVGARRVGEHRGGVVELAAYAVAQLLARGPGEGDDQHLLEGRDALGEVAGDERGDGPGLAGAGAGLEQRRAGGQRRRRCRRSPWLAGRSSCQIPRTSSCGQQRRPDRAGRSGRAGGAPRPPRPRAAARRAGRRAACSPQARTCHWSASSLGKPESLKRGVTHSARRLGVGVGLAAPPGCAAIANSSAKARLVLIGSGSGSRWPRSIDGDQVAQTGARVVVGHRRDQRAGARSGPSCRWCGRSSSRRAGRRPGRARRARRRAGAWRRGWSSSPRRGCCRRRRRRCR